LSSVLTADHQADTMLNHWLGRMRRPEHLHALAFRGVLADLMDTCTPTNQAGVGAAWRAWLGQVDWPWLAYRLLLPCALGLSAAALIAGRGSPRAALWVTMAAQALLLLCVGVALIRRRARDVPAPKRAPRRLEAIALGVGFCASALLGVASLLSGDPGRTVVYVALAGMTGPALVMAWHSVADWRAERPHRWHYELAVMPWLTALVIALSAGWLLSRAPNSEPFDLREQTLLAQTALAVVVEQMVFLRWRSGLVRPGNRRRLPFADGPFALSLALQLRAWGGYVLPAGLFVLTVLGAGPWWSVLGLVAFLAGQALWHALTSAWVS